jgi:hypothetical protein
MTAGKEIIKKEGDSSGKWKLNIERKNIWQWI